MRGLEKSSLEPDHGEIIEKVELPINKALDILLSGKEPTTYPTITGLLIAKMKLGL